MSNAMSWHQFRNTGNSVVNSAVVLGVMPQGQLLNAMEIVFREDDEAARKRRALARGGFCAYRTQQSLEERDFQFVNGRWQNWTSKPAGTEDNPLTPDVEQWAPPYLRLIDTPGWSAWLGVGPNTRQLTANGIRSDVNATEVWVQQNFLTWAIGQRCFDNVWEVVSIQVQWHNSLHLVRETPTSPWREGRDCRISHGPMAWGSTAQL
jgi:hypothetical protein